MIAAQRKRGKSLCPILVYCRIKKSSIAATLKWHQMPENAFNWLQFLNFFPGEDSEEPLSSIVLLRIQKFMTFFESCAQLWNCSVCLRITLVALSNLFTSYIQRKKQLRRMRLVFSESSSLMSLSPDNADSASPTVAASARISFRFLSPAVMIRRWTLATSS